MARKTNYTVRGTTYRIVGTTVVIEHDDGRVELYRRCTTAQDALAKLESLVIRAASRAVFDPANDEVFAR